MISYEIGWAIVTLRMNLVIAYATSVLIYNFWISESIRELEKRESDENRFYKLIFQYLNTLDLIQKLTSLES